MSQRIQARQVAVLGGLAQARCAAGGVAELPEEVGGVRVGVAGGGGADAGVHADEDADEGGGEGVGEEVGQVRVFAGGCVAGGGAFLLGWGGGEGEGWRGGFAF